MWLVILLGCLAAIVIDAGVRALLMLRLAKKIEAKGGYRQREYEIDKGTKHFTITLLGASSIYGEGSDVEIPFAGNLVGRLIKQGCKVSVHNLAVSGHKVADVTREQVPQMKPSDLVLVYAGTKDCLTLAPAARYLTDVQELASALTGHAVIWVTIGDPRLLWLFPIWLRWLFYFRARSFTKLLKQVIADRPNEQWGIVDFFNEGPVEAKRRKLTARQIVSDGIHLSDGGQGLVGELVSQAARPFVNGENL